MNNERLADFFIDQGVMDRAQADDVLLETTQNGKAIDQAMIDHGIVDEAQFYRIIADALGTEVVDLDTVEFTPEILRAIPAGLARLHRALPMGTEENTIRVALIDPLDTQTIDDLRFALGRDIQVVLASHQQIRERLKKHYGDDTSSMEEILKQLGEIGELMTLDGDKAAVANVEAEANATPIIRFVDLILYQAIRDGASDIHFEPFEAEFKIRYRVDGALYEMAPPPRAPCAPGYLAGQGDGKHEHRRAPPAARRSHPEKYRRPRGRSARFDVADAVWRKRRPARARSLHRES